MHLTNAPFRIDEVIQQGAVESSWFFAIACNNAFQNLNNKLTPLEAALWLLSIIIISSVPKRRSLRHARDLLQTLQTLSSSSSWGNLHDTLQKIFALLNGTLSGVISQTGRSLMNIEI